MGADFVQGHMDLAGSQRGSGYQEQFHVLVRQVRMAIELMAVVQVHFADTRLGSGGCQSEPRNVGELRIVLMASPRRSPLSSDRAD